MIILLDTATPICRLTVVEETGQRQYEWPADRQLARGLLRFLDQATGGLANITGIGVFRGPGSFTGLRIGLTVANTLAESLMVPIVGTTGPSWQQQALNQLADQQNHCLVVPLYGAQANITKPRK